MNRSRGEIVVPAAVADLSAAEVRRLGNGLRVVVVPDARAPVVATVLAYRAGTRDERPGEEGAAHFLEHMMFKGSARFGPGEVDRRTRALGGANNAYTSHDTTAYDFSFAADRWTHGLELEADRMAGPSLDPREVDAERRVILEEIALYEGEPWEALGEVVEAKLFGAHPYGRPVLGTRESLAGIDAAALRAFHRRLYRPDRAVLAIVGDVEIEAAHAAAAERFVGVAPAGGDDGSGEAAEESGSLGATRRIERVRKRRGEVARFLLALPAPADRDEDHPFVRLLFTILATGRSSRLHRRLVDAGQRCVWVTADLRETVEPGAATVAAEVLPGIDPQVVEAEVLEEIARLATEPPTEEEIERARRILLADWLFAHERMEPRANLAATALVHAPDLDFPRRYLDRLADARRDDLAGAAERFLHVERGAVIGWSLPRKTSRTRRPRARR